MTACAQDESQQGHPVRRCLRKTYKERIFNVSCDISVILFLGRFCIVLGVRRRVEREMFGACTPQHSYKHTSGFRSVLSSNTSSIRMGSPMSIRIGTRGLGSTYFSSCFCKFTAMPLCTNGNTGGALPVANGQRAIRQLHGESWIIKAHHVELKTHLYLYKCPKLTSQHPAEADRLSYSANNADIQPFLRETHGTSHRGGDVLEPFETLAGEFLGLC